jgi:hypothetical protein
MLGRESLSKEHAELASLAHELITITSGDSAPNSGLPEIRWKLNRHLMAHLVKEDRLLYPALQSSGDAAIAAIAKRFADEMGGLADGYRAYMAAWPSERIAQDWLAFQLETRNIVDALSLRIEREERYLYPLLGVVPRGPARSCAG